MTRRIAKALFFASLLLSLQAAFLAAQQPFVGPRAAGMAGAQTAVANDSTALWANPAGLGVDPKLDAILFGAALATDRGGFLSSVHSLSGIDPLLATPAQILGAVASLGNLNRPGVGAVGSGVAGLGVAERGLAVSVGEVAYAGVYPTIDLVHVQPNTDPATGFPFNTTGVNSLGLEARELRVGYAYGLYGRTLLVGATARYIFGRTYYNHTSVFDVAQDNVGSLIINSIKKNSKGTNAFTADVGVMLNVISSVRVGVVAAALTQPKFDVKQDATNSALLGAPAFVRLPRTLRAGAAITPISAVTVAVDYDLVAADTLIPGGKTQQFAIGGEVKLPIFSIRAGTWRDLKAIDPHWSYAAGFGLHLTVVSIDASVLLSQKGGFKFTSQTRQDVGAAVDAHFRF